MLINELKTMEIFIREKFNLPIGKPNLQELRLIVRELIDIPESNRTESVWRQVVYKHIKPNNELPLFEGLDMSDITLLQQQIILLLKGKSDKR